MAELYQIVLVLTVCLHNGQTCSTHTLDKFLDAGDCYVAQLELQAGVADDRIYQVTCTTLDGKLKVISY